MTSKFHEPSDKLSQNLARLFLVAKNMKRSKNKPTRREKLPKTRGEQDPKTSLREESNEGEHYSVLPPGRLGTTDYIPQNK